MNDWYANGGHDYSCDAHGGFDGDSYRCPKCGKDGRSRQQRRLAGEDVDKEAQDFGMGPKPIGPPPLLIQPRAARAGQGLFAFARAIDCHG